MKNIHESVNIDNRVEIYQHKHNSDKKESKNETEYTKKNTRRDENLWILLIVFAIIIVFVVFNSYQNELHSYKQILVQKDNEIANSKRCKPKGFIYMWFCWVEKIDI